MPNHRDDNESAASENSYLAMRAAKIARNEQRLHELGLVSAAAALAHAPSSSRAKPRPSKRSRPRPVHPSIPVRRSTRVTKEPRLATQQPTTASAVRSRPHAKAAAAPRSERNRDPKSTEEDNFSLAEASTTFAPSSSARELHLDVHKLLLHPKTGVLGRLLLHTGKAHVMDTCAQLAAQSSQLVKGAFVSFNKYSGVQEWANCVFLWVNFGAPNNQVDNEFYEEGRQVSWFGGSKMHHETPVIRKLRHEHFHKGRVILWCRQYIQQNKTFGPYICLGRLELLSYQSDTQPLEFVWKLLDYDKLTTSVKDKYAVLQMMKEYATSGAFL